MVGVKQAHKNPRARLSRAALPGSLDALCPADRDGRRAANNRVLFMQLDSAEERPLGSLCASGYRRVLHWR